MKPRPSPAPFATDGRAHPESSGARATHPIGVEHVDFDDACTVCGSPLEGTFCASCSTERATAEAFDQFELVGPDTDRNYNFAFAWPEAVGQ